MNIKCINCGHFISYRDMESGAAYFYFEPDSDRGPEISEWTCAACKTFLCLSGCTSTERD
jgi:hypothetical protein